MPHYGYGYGGNPNGGAAVPPAPPAVAPPGVGPAPGGMPGGPPPRVPGPPSPDELVAEAGREQQAMIDAVAAAAPQPEEAYKAREIEGVADELNRFAQAVAGDAAEGMPLVEWEAPEGEKLWNAPLPREVWVPLVAVAELVKAAGFEKHQFDPLRLVNNAALRKVQGRLRLMSKDRGLHEAIRGASPTRAPKEEREAPRAPSMRPGEESEEDRALMAAM